MVKGLGIPKATPLDGIWSQLVGLSGMLSAKRLFTGNSKPKHEKRALVLPVGNPDVVSVGHCTTTGDNAPK
tara:strand:- start:39 stop:251 length:213 start_codon:yes stop_codon:yes gene_type:complete